MTFKAFRVNQDGEEFSRGIEKLELDDLTEGDVVIKVHYSSVNYKDAMASVKNSKIAQKYPLTPGIDLAGEVVESNSEQFREGDKVVATSYDIGVSKDGGYSEYARIPSEWIVELPEGMTLEESMIYGTAGFTAALSIHRLEEAGIRPDDGQILVTGATGGVGSMAIAMLARLGYSVVASTGKESEHDYLKELGAKEVISREDVYDGGKIKPLDKQNWAGAVDPTGGNNLAAILGKLQYSGAVAVSGLTAGTDVPATVFPFILRGISLLGVDSVQCPMTIRRQIWNRMATDLKPEEHFGNMKNEVTLEELPETLNTLLEGKARGRNIVKL
ncbi:putative quinone oxidoreductase YhfP [Thalassobacillus devorans]|uniref:Quinone oxidoreductase YhfP n=1 Tax=Thalassobacillus devorans TaxID=279813 RepID=A0ABQ1PV67_9BACI|nr:acryloyl-CoA reductase [Thalassobacillus devorans]NIK30865.1 putative YhdH/YhfP family quinone oxidoreductase [Thalassobacillus devorans]GGD04874.1 putative quinone oxidoreductase YhfP [Thalassobacillus devorans]